MLARGRLLACPSLTLYWRRQLGAAVMVALVAAMPTVMAEEVHLRLVSFSDLRGWSEDDHGAALAALRRSCAEIIDRGHGFSRPTVYGGAREDWLGVCRRATGSGPLAARQFFEAEFFPVLVHDPERPQGLFTGYYEPEVKGSPRSNPRYGVPLYRRPPDLVAFDEAARRATGLSYGRLVNGRPAPYYTRKEIESGALAGRGLELLWLSDWADAFFLQVQGSGRVRLDDGSVVRLGFAGKTGLPYTAIGGILAKRGDIPPAEVSMQSIRAWMAKHPDKARELMWENQSYVFFQELSVSDPALGPPGAQKVPLTPQRSIAVDRAYWAFGTPIWLDAEVPFGGGGTLVPFRRLLVAQDTGTAIRGRARGDVFWGAGDQAALVAGHMKSPGTMVALLPKPVAARLGLNSR